MFDRLNVKLIQKVKKVIHEWENISRSNEGKWEGEKV